MGVIRRIVNISVVRDEVGATAVEYAIIASLVAAVLVAAVAAVGLKVVDLFGLVGRF